AEDGIRDYKVTGVQTCALPISSIPGARLRLLGLQSPISFPEEPTGCDHVGLLQGCRLARGLVRPTASARRVVDEAHYLGTESRLAQERRVGKECRSRRRREQ